MSYGVWKHRGKNWASVEIDTPVASSYDYWDEKERKESERLSEEIGYQVCFFADLFALRFFKYHLAKGRTIVSACPGGGEHVLWIAFTDRASLEDCIEKQHSNGDPYFTKQAVDALFDGELLRKEPIRNEHFYFKICDRGYIEQSDCINLGRQRDMDDYVAKLYRFEAEGGITINEAFNPNSIKVYNTEFSPRNIKALREYGSHMFNLKVGGPHGRCPDYHWKELKTFLV